MKYGCGDSFIVSLDLAKKLKLTSLGCYIISIFNKKYMVKFDNGSTGIFSEEEFEKEGFVKC